MSRKWVGGALQGAPHRELDSSLANYTAPLPPHWEMLSQSVLGISAMGFSQWGGGGRVSELRARAEGMGVWLSQEYTQH